MKKNGSSLLVIAVMFTFSFGSAFAATADANKVAYQTVLDKITKAAEDAKAAELKNMNDALSSLFGTAAYKTYKLNGVDTTLTKEAVKAGYEKEYAKVVAAIEAKLTENLNEVQAAIILDNASGDAFSGYFDADGVADDGYPAEKAAWYTISVTGFDYANAITIVSDTWNAIPAGYDAFDYACAYQLDADKAAALAAVEAAEASLEATYSKVVKGGTSPYDEAKALVTKAYTALGLINVTDTAACDYVAYSAALKAVKDVYTAPVNQAKPTGALYEGGTVVVAGQTIAFGTDGLNDLPKIANEPTEAAKLEWAKNKVLSVVVGDLNKYKAEYIAAENNTIIEESLKTKPNQVTIATAKDNIAKYEAQFDAAIEVVTYLVNDCDTITDLINVNATTFTDSTHNVTNWGNPAKDAVRVPAKDFAVEYPTRTGAVAVYTIETCLNIAKAVDALEADAELAKKTVELDGTVYAAIEDALEDAIDEAYYGNAAASIDRFSAAELLKAKKDALIGADGATVKVGGKTYDTILKWDDVLTDAYSTYNKDKYDVVRGVVADAKAAVKAAESIADAEAAFLAGLDALDAVPTVSDKAIAQAKKDFSDLKDKYEADIEAYANYKAAGYPANTYDYVAGTFKSNLKADLLDAYTVDELTALYNEAIAEIDGLKTEAELKAAKADLEKQIAAIPTAVTVADKDVVAALADAIEDHNDYCTMIGNSTEKVTLTTPLTNAADAIKKAEAKAIKDAYDAIKKDGKVALDEAAAVEALRDAFDAFCEYYTPVNAHNGQLVSATTTYVVSEANVAAVEDELYTAQAKAVREMIAVLSVTDVDATAVREARAALNALEPGYGVGTAMYDKLVALEKILADDVEAVKINAGSSAKKGSITVKWTVDGNEDAVEAYEIWKSTKKNSGFKKAFTTEKKSYKNTKGLKKGTRYYYKVRAIAFVDGEKITSDWSNKAYRIAK